jgi:FKBP-type peptidyl-prolyl cis-trans isomerase FkpA
MNSCFLFKSFFLISIFLFFFSCLEEKKDINKVDFDEYLLKAQLEKVQKPVIKMENDIINSYIKQHQLDLKITGSGLRYRKLKSNPKGKPLQSMDEVYLKFKVFLLSGELCYSSEKTGIKKVKIDYDHIETGLHEGLKLLCKGEKAIFIIPSHLAHGTVGDYDKIPPKSPILIDVEVLDK